MKRSDLEHLIRAAGAITGCDRLIILGSQAILGYLANAPEELTFSEEMDTFPQDDPLKADLIDGSIGEKSLFHEEFGYYAHGISPETAILPNGWEKRLILVQNANTRGIAGLCLHPKDLAISKLAAGRPKDLDFFSALKKHGIVNIPELKELANTLAEPYKNKILEILEAG